MLKKNADTWYIWNWDPSSLWRKRALIVLIRRSGWSILMPTFPPPASIQICMIIILRFPSVSVWNKSCHCQPKICTNCKDHLLPTFQNNQCTRQGELNIECVYTDWFSANDERRHERARTPWNTPNHSFQTQGRILQPKLGPTQANPLEIAHPFCGQYIVGKNIGQILKTTGRILDTEIS